MFRYTRIIRVGFSSTLPSVNLRQKITHGINNSLRLYANKPPSLEDKCRVSNKPPEKKPPPPCRTALYEGKVCPPKPEEDKKQKSNRRNLITGLTLLGITLIALWKFLDSNPDLNIISPPEKKKDKKKREIVKIPSSSGDIPKNVKYLLIGGGTASFSAFRAIKSNDPTAQVLIITDDQYYPYMRPPLSKEMWYNEDPDSARKLNFKQWNGSERSLFYEPDEFYVDTKNLLEQGNGGVAVARGWNVKKVDVVGKKVVLEDGAEIEYDKCLIATGATPKNLDIFENASPAVQEKVLLYRNIFDYEDLEERFKDSKSIAIIGGGFLGSELACSLARRARKNQAQIIQIFKESGNMGRVLPEYLSLWTTKKVQSEGVNVMTNTEVEDVQLRNDCLQLRLSNGKDIQVDQVIVAVGVQANTELAESSQLEIDPDLGGFLVNTELQARSNLYIAGDAACFYDTKFGRRRVEHHDHAVVSGRLAGENMTGASKPYHHQSMFWSDLGPEVGYEAIGIIDSALPTVGVFAKTTPKDTPPDTVSLTKGSKARVKLIDNETDNEASTNTDDSKTNETNPDNELETLVPMDDNETVQGQDENYGKGVIFYLRNDLVVGIVLWNVFNRMSIARQVLSDNRKYDDLNEVAKLFNIHED